MDLIIDLLKGRVLHKEKLVRRRVMVRGKNGRIFYRFQWVDPGTGKPAFHQPIESNEQPKTQKQHIDEYLKNLKPRAKDELLEKHGIQWERHESDQRDRINAMEALRQHLYKNPHLAGAEHLPQDDKPRTADGTDKFQDWSKRFKNDPAKLYELMKKHGVADSDPRVPGDKAGPIKHMRNMQKLREHIEGGDLFDHPDYQPNVGSKKPDRTSSEASKAEAGGNTIQGILDSMPSEEQYNLMRKLGIADNDPRLDESLGKKALIKHMRNKMALREAIEKDPSILNKNGYGEVGDHELQRLSNMDAKQRQVHQVKEFLDSMSKDMKQEALDQYADEDIIKNRKRNDHPQIDWKDAMTALRSLFEKKPELMSDLAHKVQNEQLRNLKIGNKQMGRILRNMVGLKGIGDVKRVSDEEWSFGEGGEGRGFVRREDDDEGNPILSIVDMGKDGNDWDEYVKDMSDVKKHLDGTSDVLESAMTPEDAVRAIRAGHITPDISKQATRVMGDAVKTLAGDVWMLSHKMDLGHEQTVEMLKSLGIPTDGVKYDAYSPEYAKAFYPHLFQDNKNMNANDYLIPTWGKSYNTVALIESAKNWTPEQRHEARKELISSRIRTPAPQVDIPANVKDPDIHRRFQQLAYGTSNMKELDDSRRQTYADLLHHGTKHIPFDLFTDVLAKHGTHFDADSHDGCYYEPSDHNVYLDHGYFTVLSTKAIKDPLNHTGGGGTSMVFTVAHEMAHAIDHFFGSSDTMGKWSSPTAKKYAPNHLNVIFDSYKKAVESSNPRGVVVEFKSDQQPYRYHADNFTSNYEGRIYDSTDVSYAIDPDTLKKQLVTKKLKDNRGYGVELWAENCARYAYGLATYQKMKREDPDIANNTADFDDYAQTCLDDLYDSGGGTDDDVNRGDAVFTFNSKRSTPFGVAAAYARAKQIHPELYDGIHQLFNRGDFIDMPTEERNTYNNQVERDEQFRRSLSDIDLVIEVDKE